MPGIQQIQEDRNYNLQLTSNITKAAHFFEVFLLQNNTSGVQTQWHLSLSYLKIYLGPHPRIN
jgi:hypothetical protein